MFIFCLASELFQTVLKWISSRNIRRQLRAMNINGTSMLGSVLAGDLVVQVSWHLHLVDSKREVEPPDGELPINTPSYYYSSHFIDKCKVTLESDVSDTHLNAGSQGFKGTSATVELHGVVPKDGHVSGV